MKLVGSAVQQTQDYLYRADLTLTGAAQLVLARSAARCLLLLHNAGINAMYLEFGAGAAHCALTNGVVTSVTIDNAGFGFTSPPLLRFLGGGGNVPYLGLNQPNGQAPSNPAQAHVALSGANIGAVTIDNGGSGYQKAPYVQVIASDLDPYGCAVPAAGTSILLASGATMRFDATACPTEAVAVIGTSGDHLICRWMD